MPKASVWFTLSHGGGMHDIKKIKRELDALPGVTSVSISDRTGQVAVDFDPSGAGKDQIRKQLQNMGYEVHEVRQDEHIR